MAGKNGWLARCDDDCIVWDYNFSRVGQAYFMTGDINL